MENPVKRVHYIVYIYIVHYSGVSRPKLSQQIERKKKILDRKERTKQFLSRNN